MIYIPNAVTSDSRILFIVINNVRVAYGSLDLYLHPHLHKTRTHAAWVGTSDCSLASSYCHCHPVVPLAVVITRAIYTLRAAVVGGAGCSPIVVAIANAPCFHPTSRGSRR
jgi:hypothetical protein